MKNKTSLSAKLIVGAIVAVWVAVGALVFFVLLPPSLRARDKMQEAAAAKEERCKHPPAELVRASRKELAPLVESTALASAGKIEPASTGTIAEGFRIWDIRPRSLYDRVGLCDEDVVLAVGGRKLDTPESTLEVYDEVKDMSEIRVDVRRANRRHVYTIVLE